MITLKRILIIAALLFAQGCSHYYHGTIQDTSFSQSKATIIVYPNIEGRKHNKGILDDIPINMDGKTLGIMSTDKPLKIDIEPGEHKFFVDNHLPFGTREISIINIPAGKLTYLRAWLDNGFMVSHFRIEVSEPVGTYSTLTYEK